MKKALAYGIFSSMFFAITFILNRSMNLEGSYWMWGACLRYILTLPMLVLILAVRPGRRVRSTIEEVKRKPSVWIIWGTVGFGLFYLPLCLASVFGESWMTASSWQMTIIAGAIMTPLFGKPVPKKNILAGLIILAGIFMMQIPSISGDNLKGNLIALIPIAIGAFCYPLGNRKVMEHCSEGMDTMERILGMVIGSYPFWIIVAVIAFIVSGPPAVSQIIKSGTVALVSGIIATSMLFHGTDLVRNNPKQLVLVESTQCGEVVFTLIGGVLILGDAMPAPIAFAGIGVIVAGMILNSLISSK